ncbi:Oidioi.mRNA.OKI2018_I69.PAR.g11483.t1.cds [Oikopleura dioica]|uniref:Oidioi.mRNA.OKI2018_I69.PAR.g11483.t1.cds n=1 Tax=Oikopleura dioica TaxID=34765 RepID=A0ABN7RYX0_OIKDI|nr:Oidioi.mRNA.OKI2018_I69.PAR.g11483.t1.cds [Oikopleura dioica]
MRLFSLAVLALSVCVSGETHQLEAVLTDKLGVTNTKLLLSNVKSTKPEASLDFDGSISFPCVVRIPASIQWDEIRAQKYISTTVYEPGRLDILTDSEGNFLSISSKGDSFQGPNSISTTVDISTIPAGPVPETQAFLQKVEKEKKEKENAPQGSWLSRNWMYVAIGFFVLVNLGGGQ